MERAKQHKTVSVDRGILLLRYAAAEDEVCPPKIEISTDPEADGHIELILHPDCNEPVLWEPGASLLIRAEEPGTLDVSVVATKEGGSTSASLRIEPLNQGKSQQVQTTANVGSAGVELLGHVARIGDVRVPAGEWVAGPNAPAHIEGIALGWPGKPKDVDIQYAVKLARRVAPSDQIMSLGGYAGTRGLALAVVGLRFELVGSGARDFQFAIEAIFLGSPIMNSTGQKVVLAGPTGREPLVGLRVAIEPRPAEVGVPAQRPTEASRPASRVRVFRSRERG